MNTNTQPKVFVLLKDLPNADAGTEFTFSFENNWCHYKGTGRSGKEVCYDQLIVETPRNLEWFKEKQQPIEERIVVTVHELCNSQRELYGYAFHTPIISKEKHEAVKQAIEQVLNNEGFDQYGYTLAEYWHGEYLKLKELNSSPTPQPQDTKEEQAVAPTLERNEKVVCNIEGVHIPPFNNSYLSGFKSKEKDSIEDKAKQLANEIFLKVLSELDKK